jgi:hypothetical protein
VPGSHLLIKVSGADLPQHAYGGGGSASCYLVRPAIGVHHGPSFNILAVGVLVLWGVNNPAVWGVGIVNLVFWIGIGHAGTFISAFLLLMRQHWRSAFSRFAEAYDTICAGLRWLCTRCLHVGRIHSSLTGCSPIPNTLLLNPNWKQRTRRGTPLRSEPFTGFVSLIVLVRGPAARPCSDAR